MSAEPGSRNMAEAFDPAVLLALTGGDQEFLRELADEFASSARRARVELTAALAAGDLTAMAAIAHRFKSAAGQVGARRAQELSAALEHMGRTGGAVATALAEDLVRQLEVLEGALLVFAEAQAGGTGPTASDAGPSGS